MPYQFETIMLKNCIFETDLKTRETWFYILLVYQFTVPIQFPADLVQAHPRQ